MENTSTEITHQSSWMLPPNASFDKTLSGCHQASLSFSPFSNKVLLSDGIGSFKIVSLPQNERMPPCYRVQPSSVTAIQSARTCSTTSVKVGIALINVTINYQPLKTVEAACVEYSTCNPNTSHLYFTRHIHIWICHMSHCWWWKSDYLRRVAFCRVNSVCGRQLVCD